MTNCRIISKKKKKIRLIIEIIWWLIISSDRTKKRKMAVFKCKEKWSDIEWNIHHSNEITVFGKKKCFIIEKKSFVFLSEFKKYKAIYSILK